METSFWHQCWEKDQIGFHQDDFNPLMMKLWPRFQAWQEGQGRSSEQPSVIFVPLCGKSADMLYIASQQKVIGAELSDIACRDFYLDNHIPYQLTNTAIFGHYQSERIDLYQGDFFALTPQHVNTCQHIFDRAALVALPKALRAQYVAHLRGLFPAKTELFLLSLEYPEGEIKGPPFNVTENEVNSLFKGCKITKVLTEPLSDQQFARRKLKVSSLVEVVYFIEF